MYDNEIKLINAFWILSKFWISFQPSDLRQAIMLPGKKTLLQNKHKGNVTQCVVSSYEGVISCCFFRENGQNGVSITAEVIYFIWVHFYLTRCLILHTWRNFLPFLALENFWKDKGCGLYTINIMRRANLNVFRRKYFLLHPITCNIIRLSGQIHNPLKF